jgi:hypothetical protein
MASRATSTAAVIMTCKIGPRSVGQSAAVHHNPVYKAGARVHHPSRLFL